MPNRVLNLAYVTLRIEDGILLAVYKEGTEMDLTRVQEVIQARKKLTGGLHYPCLSDIRGLKAVSKEARAFMAAEGTNDMLALAVITGNAFTRSLAHLFLSVNKPKVTMCFFGEVEPAKEWLQKFVP